MQTSKFQFINSLWFKLIGFLAMTLDHIGVFLLKYATPNYPYGHADFFKVPMLTTGYIFRCIGRIALPIFLILFVEGIRHSKDKELYFIRLAIMAALIMVVEIVLYFVYNATLDGNIFLTMLVSGLFIVLLERKDNKRYYCLIPLGYIIMCTISVIYKSFTDGKLLWWPDFLNCEYTIYAFLLILGFYYSYKIADYRVLKLNDKKSIEELREFPYYRSLVNILWALTIFIVTMFFYILSKIDSRLDIYYMPIQSWVLVSCLLPLLYNGKKGYSNKKLQHSFYLYYPLHLLILFIIFISVYGVIK